MLFLTPLRFPAGISPDRYSTHLLTHYCATFSIVVTLLSLQYSNIYRFFIGDFFTPLHMREIGICDDRSSSLAASCILPNSFLSPVIKSVISTDLLLGLLAPIFDSEIFFLISSRLLIPAYVFPPHTNPPGFIL